MKCPKCERNHPKKEGQTCTCGYHFVFNPAEDKDMTDGKMAALIRGVSNNGTYFFTRNQLYAQYCRKTLLGARGARKASTVLTVILGIVFLASLFGLVGASSLMWGIFFIIALLIRVALRGKLAFSRQEFNNLLGRWHSSHKEEKLLTKPRLQSPPKEWTEKDIYDYGVERILIVDDDLLVDQFVLNGFHAQEKALVISITGYPEYIGTHMEKILQESPDIPVFFLHAAPTEEHAAYGLRKAQALVGGREITDLGLMHDDLKAMPGLKILPSEDWKNRIPVDAIAFGGLSLMLTAALTQGLPLSGVMAAAASDSSADAYGYG